MIYTRSRPVFELVSVGASDGRGTNPGREALDFIRALTGSDSYRTISAPRVGTETVRYIAAFEKDGSWLYTDVVAWRQDSVVVIVAVTSEDASASPVAYAQRQAARLARALT